MSAVNLFLLAHFLVISLPAGIALSLRRWWTGGLIVLGGLLGLILGIYVVWAGMSLYEKQTGYSAGNGGIMFICSMPIGTVAGIIAGAVCGHALDQRRIPKYEDHTYCPDCGYAMRGLHRLGCPKCGWKRKCPQCGYPMRGLMQIGCPECGWNRDDKRGPTARAPDRRDGDAP